MKHVTALTKDEAAEMVTRLSREVATLRTEILLLTGANLMLRSRLAAIYGLEA